MESHCLAKGVSKVVTKTYTIDSYRSVLEAADRVARGDKESKPYILANMYAIRSKEHEMFLISQRKVALNGIDNKKMKTFCGRMYAYGHYLTPQIMTGEI